MKTYAVLLRGINVGGKNKLPMVDLRACLENAGFKDVITYIQSGNVVLKSASDAKAVSGKIEKLLPEHFSLDSTIVRILSIDKKKYEAIVREAPKGFGTDPGNYRYDVIFLIGISAAAAMKEIEARENVDTVWKGSGVIYFRRPSLTSPDASKSYINKLIQRPLYQSVTIRNWNTTTKMLEMLG